ncbi:MAG: HAMP domain-containing histidine kinase [Thermogemmatispora sp.]|uniref:sensor histidine kinase n=1 Tax=Thermogemmatispora sp. TaxID=1968838 RepID=UPI00261CC877|nr:HAMP domain-containing sensor histidine kinase [Thermogemmatispora sp.]MBX5455852.1 HAMP domain-containing histidine kinase [Thermogemmatispora sp.]
MKERWASLWLRARRRRALLEAVLFASLLCGFICLTSATETGREFSLLLLAPFGLGYFALRAEVGPPPRWRSWARDLAWGLLLILLLCGLPFLLLSLGHRLGATFFFPRLAAFPLVLLGMAPVALVGYIVWRGFLRLLSLWSRLRRRQLLWALTHAHAVMVLLAAGLLILLFDLLALSNVKDLALLISVTMMLGLVSFIALLAVIPPTAFFSYLVVRRTTARLRALAEAAHALRLGNYGVRVPVEGEDEVAQLQADFNAMAAELERALRELKQERDTVAGLLKTQRELVAAVSHELRTPVATVRGYLEAALRRLDRGELPESLPRDLEVMEAEVLRLQRLVEDLFALACAEVGRLTLRCVPTDVGELARRLVAARAPLAWQSGRVQVVAETPPTGPLALADPERLAQALQNLLHNGIRHTPPGGIVAVAVSQEENKVVIQVRDTGEGIPAEELPRIWERFYQASSKLRRDGSGSGLGLALVKEWVEAMQGSVAATSVLSEGSCFTLYLPAAPVDAGLASQRRATASLGPEPPQTDGLRPLVRETSEREDQLVLHGRVEQQ